MAGEKSGQVAGGGPMHTAEAKAKAKQTRERNKLKEVDLDNAGKFAVQTLMQASKACQQLAVAIKQGQEVSPEAIKAAAIVTANVGSAIFA